ARRRDPCGRTHRTEHADCRCPARLSGRSIRGREFRRNQAVLKPENLEGCDRRKRRTRTLDSACVRRARPAGRLRERRQSVPHSLGCATAGVAVRRALGAGRLGIARYFFAESALLSIAGGAIGLALAWGAVRLLVAHGPATLPRLGEVRLDGVTVAYTCGLTMLAALAFGAIPLWRGAAV